jgi:hypothetical protein
MRLQCAVSDDVLRMALGCRPYNYSWMDQRKLEFAFRLATMAADRLPARLDGSGRLAAFGPQRASQHTCWYHGMVASLEHSAGIEAAELAAAAGISMAGFKRTAIGAVRKRDVLQWAYHLRVLGDLLGEHTNQRPRYLAGPLTEVQRLSSSAALGSCLRPGAAISRARPERHSAAHSARSARHHALLASSAFAAERAAMLAAVQQVVE